MLRELKDGALVDDGRTLLGGRRWRFVAGRQVAAARWRAGELRALLAAAAQEPVLLVEDERHRYWLFEERFYREDDGLQAQDVLALVREREGRTRRRLERARAALAQEATPEPATVAGRRREPIPRAVRLAVFERDGGRCVECGATFELHFDHVIPLSLGGSSGPENLQVLCAPCNQRKGASVA
jgi:hypothetical protein